MSNVILHPRAHEREQFECRLDGLRREFLEFCDDFRPETVIDSRTASLAAVFVAFKLDGGDG